ncbi:MAG TPA: NAD-dependent epimerase/dehydratase family protein, partial [Acidimicrobiales bacterium]
SVFGPALDGPEIAAGTQVTMARRVLDAAGAAGVRTVVVLSSATVYGAWANNAVPLTEDAPVRPQPELTFAVHQAEVERVAGDWREDHPGATVALLRPAPLVDDGWANWLTRSLDAASNLPTREDDPPAQYLHLDDLASAVDVARTARLDGPFNVAPDGWLTTTQRRALDPAPRVRLPERVVVELATWRWRLGLAPIPPGILPYARYGWVVANDRLKAHGWSAAHENDEAYVDGHEAGPLENISPRRRQELALGVAGTALAGGVVAAVAAVRRHRKP